MDNRRADFIAQLSYRTRSEGRWNTPAYSGYRPAVKFPFTEMQTTGKQTFIDKELVYPGETVTASIKIVSVNFFANALAEGMEFEFKECKHVIGTGIILTILNPELKKVNQ